MKKTFSLVLAGAFLVSGLTVSRVRAHQDQDPRIALEERMIELEQVVAEFAARNEALNARLEQVIVYLDQRAKSGHTLLQEIGESESLGFTAGINFNSREVLIAAWRTYYGEQQKGLPRPVKKRGNADRSR